MNCPWCGKPVEQDFDATWWCGNCNASGCGPNMLCRGADSAHRADPNIIKDYAKSKGRD